MHLLVSLVMLLMQPPLIYAVCCDFVQIALSDFDSSFFIEFSRMVLLVPSILPGVRSIT